MSVENEFLSTEDEQRIIWLLQNSLEHSGTIPEALDTFSMVLEDFPLLANAVSQYCDLIKNRKYLNSLRTIFNQVHDLILKIEPAEEDESIDETKSKKTPIRFKIEGRRKGVINTIEKMLRLLKQGKSLDLLRDTMGIRIVFFGEETDTLQKQCYAITEPIIKFMSNQRFTLCEADKIKTDVNLDDDVNILIPEYSFVSPSYQTCIKDYIKFPKANGYQSLHIVFRAMNSSFLEIQIRTEEMHINAEYISAQHGLYKTDKYGSNRLHSKIDFSKIHMPGFRYLGENTIYDDIGLQASFLTLYRTHSF